MAALAQSRRCFDCTPCTCKHPPPRARISLLADSLMLCFLGSSVALKSMLVALCSMPATTGSCTRMSAPTSGELLPALARPVNQVVAHLHKSVRMFFPSRPSGVYPSVDLDISLPPKVWRVCRRHGAITGKRHPNRFHLQASTVCTPPLSGALEGRCYLRCTLCIQCDMRVQRFAKDAAIGSCAVLLQASSLHGRTH